MNKSPESNSKNEPHDELRQQLWELSYGLLEDDDAAALRAQIKSDPAIARLYSEVRLQADLVGRAARVEDSSLHIAAGPDSKASKSGSRSSKSSSGKSWQAAEQQRWGTNWLAVAGTVALLLLLAFGLNQPRAVTNSVAQADYLITQITAPAKAAEGLAQTVEINTTDVHNRGRSAELEVRLVDNEGRETFRKQLTTSSDGKASVVLPGNVLKPGVRLEAIPDRAGAVVSAELQVTEEKKRRLLLLEKPSAKPGETVGFTMAEIGVNSKQLTAPEADELMIEDRTGVDVVEPTWEADRQAGVIRGQFALPRDPSIESEQLAIRRRALSEAKEQRAKGELGGDAARKSNMLTERQQLPLDRAGMRDANRSLANGAQAGTGGGLVGGNAGSDADAMRLQRAATPKAAELRADALSKAAVPSEGELKPGGSGSASGSGNLAAPLKPALARGGVQDAPAPPAPAALPRPAAAPGAAAPPTLPAAPPELPGGATDRKNADKSLADTQRNNAQANGAPLNGPAPLGASAKAGAMISEQGGPGATARGMSANKDGRNLPALEGAAKSMQRAEGGDTPAVAGPSAQATAAKAQQDDVLAAALPAYRTADAAANELRFAVVDGWKDSYAPGEKVRLQIRVTDEQGKAAAAMVGVRVWNDVAVATTKSPLLLVDALASEEHNEQVDQFQELAMAAPQDLQLREAAKQSAAFAANAASAKPAAENQPVPEQPQRQMKRMSEAEQDKVLEQKVIEKPATSSQEKFDNAAGPQNVDLFFAADRVTADNRATVQQEYQAALAAKQAQHFDRIRAAGRVLVWGGAGLMLLIGLLLIARSQLKTAVWVPAVGIAAVCLALGLAWFVPSQPIGWELARIEDFGTVPAAPPEAKPPTEPPTVTIAPERPVDAPTPAAGADVASETLKEVAPPPVVQPGTPGEQLARGPSTDEKMKLQQPTLLRTEQPLADAKQDDRAAADKPQAKKSAARESLERRDFGGGGGRGFSEAAPDTLFWRPLSLVGSDGLLTIEFNMPAAESDYHLLLDAVGNGRMGGQDRLLICREPQ